MSNKAAEKKAVARKDMTMRQWIWKEMKRNKVAYLMVAPYMLIFTIFTILPVVLSAVISFTNFNMLEWPDFVFLDNYITLYQYLDFCGYRRSCFLSAFLLGCVVH